MAAVSNASRLFDVSESARPGLRKYLTALVVVFNLIMGSGILAVPKAFYEAGWLLGIIVLCVMGFFAFCSIVWLYECQLRAQALNAAFIAGAIRVVPFRGTSGLGAERQAPTTEHVGALVDGSRRSVSPQQDFETAPDTNQVGYGVCCMPANTLVDLPTNCATPQHSTSNTPAAAGRPLFPGFAVSPAVTPRAQQLAERDAEDTGGSLECPLMMPAALLEGRERGESVALLDSDGNVINTSVALPTDCHVVVYDAAHAGEERPDAPQTTTPFVLAVKAQIAQTFLGLFDVEAALPRAALADSIDYAALEKEPDCWLEQDYVASVCGGRPVAVLGNVAQSLLLLAGTWLYLVVVAQTAVLLIPLPGYTSFLECNAHDAAAFAAHPRCTHATRIFIALFTTVFLAALVRNWAAVDVFQRVATAVTYLALGIMVASCAVGMGQRPFDAAASPERVQHVPAVNAAKFSDLFGVVAFCLVCHPGSALMLRRMPRRQDVVRVYLAAFLLIVGLYCGVSIVVAFYMGPRVASVMNMSWRDFGRTWGATDSVPLQVLGVIVMGFPLFSITACYTLYLRALAESMEAFVPVSFHVRVARLVGRSYHGPGVSLWPASHLMRFIAVMVPAILAFVTFKFDKAMAVAGFFAFFLVFFAPGVMQLYSSRLMRRLGLPRSPYETWLGDDRVVIVVLVFCLAAAGYYVVEQMIPALAQ